MAAPRVTEGSTMRIAMDLGIDIDRLKSDMNDPIVGAHISLSMELANQLAINGTPAFIIGDQIAPGLVPLDKLKAMVATARR